MLQALLNITMLAILLAAFSFNLSVTDEIRIRRGKLTPDDSPFESWNIA